MAELGKPLYLQRVMDRTDDTNDEILSGDPSDKDERSNVPASFILKLYEILQNPDYGKYLEWNDAGDVFVLFHMDEFSTEVLPRHFKHSRFQSFVRQLNIYGFYRVSDARKSSYVRNKDVCVFSHKNFQRGREDLLPSIRRRNPQKKKTKKTGEGEQDGLVEGEQKPKPRRTHSKRSGSTELNAKTWAETAETVRKLNEGFTVLTHKTAMLDTLVEGTVWPAISHVAESLQHHISNVQAVSDFVAPMSRITLGTGLEADTDGVKTTLESSLLEMEASSTPVLKRKRTDSLKGLEAFGVWMAPFFASGMASSQTDISPALESPYLTPLPPFPPSLSKLINNESPYLTPLPPFPPSLSKLINNESLSSGRTIEPTKPLPIPERNHCHFLNNKSHHHLMDFKPQHPSSCPSSVAPPFLLGITNTSLHGNQSFLSTSLSAEHLSSSWTSTSQQPHPKSRKSNMKSKTPYRYNDSNPPFFLSESPTYTTSSSPIPFTMSRRTSLSGEYTKQNGWTTTTHHSPSHSSLFRTSEWMTTTDQQLPHTAPSFPPSTLDYTSWLTFPTPDYTADNDKRPLIPAETSIDAALRVGDKGSFGGYCAGEEGAGSGGAERRGGGMVWVGDVGVPCKEV